MSDSDNPARSHGDKPARPKRSLYAIWAVIYGVLGLALVVLAGALVSAGSVPIVLYLVLGFVLVLPSGAAAICGHLALARIRESDGKLGGTRWATSGLAMGYVVLLIVAGALTNVVVERATSPTEAADSQAAGGSPAAGAAGGTTGETNQFAVADQPAATNNDDSETLLLKLPTSGPAVVPAPQADQPDLVVCIREIEAFDPRNPSKSLGRFGVNTPLVIGKKDEVSGKYHVTFKPKKGTDIHGLCNASDLGR